MEQRFQLHSAKLTYLQGIIKPKTEGLKAHRIQAGRKPAVCLNHNPALSGS
jgi:hypothetical protein